MDSRQRFPFLATAFRAVPCTLAVLVLCVVPSLVPAQEKSRTTDELTQQADLVVVGKVAGMESGWNSDRSRIYTTVKLAVDQTLKGDAGSASVSILVPGGEVDGVGELYSHTPQFKKNEDVVVFAEKDKQGRYRISGGHEGKVSVMKDEATGTRFLPNRMRLENFETEIRNSVRAQSMKE